MMSIPDYQTIMHPLLRYAGDAEKHTLREAIDALAHEFGLSDEERNELYPTGQKAIFDDRVGWARTYLKQAGLVEYPKRGVFQITQRGLEVLASNPNVINVSFLMRFDEFQDFVRRKRQSSTDDVEEQPSAEPEDERTPEETIEVGYKQLRKNLELELLNKVKECSPSFFERLVVDLLVRMGYGGSRQDAGKAIGRSGDAGIDGIIKEDKLGLDAIYIQAKRWDSTVIGRPEIQKFVGALQGQRARKGVFITTSTFSDEAKEYAARIESKVILVDGHQLAVLMVDYGVGVSTAAVYEIKNVDSDYFADE